MALKISYFTGSGQTRETDKVYGVLLSSASVTLTGTSASCGTVPNGTSLARIRAGETCVVSNNISAASDTNGVYMEAGEIIDLIVSPGTVFYAKTTT